MTEQTLFRAERRAKAIDYLGGECQKCGATNSLEFDHTKRDRTSYKQLVSYLLACNWDKVVQELNRCQLLCKSCHIKKSTYERHGDVSIKHSASSYRYGRCRCEICTYANSVYKSEWCKARTIKRQNARGVS